MADEERPEGVWKYVSFQDGSKMLWVESKNILENLEVCFFSKMNQSVLKFESKQILFFRCGKCDRVGMVGLNCNKRDCNTKFHRYIILVR